MNVVVEHRVRGVGTRREGGLGTAVPRAERIFKNDIRHSSCWPEDVSGTLYVHSLSIHAARQGKQHNSEKIWDRLDIVAVALCIIIMVWCSCQAM